MFVQGKNININNLLARIVHVEELDSGYVCCIQSIQC